jgi:NADH-quinone oxidoreductase subunit J
MQWIAEIWQDYWDEIALALTGAGVWWMMPRRVRLPKLLGLAVALLGAYFLAKGFYLGNSEPADTGETVLFSVFTAAAVASAILMITNRNPVYAALWFALTTLSVCGLFWLQFAPFLAAATVIVYAGAIVVTFVFVIMLAQQSGATVYDQSSRQPLLATIAAFLLLGAILGMLSNAGPQDFFGSAMQSPTPIANPLSRPPENLPLNDKTDTMTGLGRSLFGE